MQRLFENLTGVGNPSHDPLVAGHILAGTALGVGGAVLFRLGFWLVWQRDARLVLQPYTLLTLSGAGLVRGVVASPVSVTVYAMFAGLLFLLCRAVFRKMWLAAAAFVLLVAPLTIVVSGGQPAVFAVVLSLAFDIEICNLQSRPTQAGRRRSGRTRVRSIPRPGRFACGLRATAKRVHLASACGGSCALRVCRRAGPPLREGCT
jgi:hypothetical protein